jgi:uncharacterized protein
MLLGLILGSALQELMPRAWIARVLGYPSWRTIAIGSVLSIPGMMCTGYAAPVVISLRTLRATGGSRVPSSRSPSLLTIGIAAGVTAEVWVAP